MERKDFLRKLRSQIGALLGPEGKTVFDLSNELDRQKKKRRVVGGARASNLGKVTIDDIFLVLAQLTLKGVAERQPAPEGSLTLWRRAEKS